MFVIYIIHKEFIDEKCSELPQIYKEKDNSSKMRDVNRQSKEKEGGITSKDEKTISMASRNRRRNANQPPINTQE